MLTKFQIFKKESESEQPVQVAYENYCYKISKISPPNPNDADPGNNYKNYYAVYADLCDGGPARRSYAPGSYDLGSASFLDISPYQDKDFGLTSFAWTFFEKITLITYFTVSQDKNTLTLYPLATSKAGLEPITLTYKK